MVPPEIRINYLATQTDRTANVEGLKILRKILAAPAMRPFVAEEIYPGAKCASDDDLLQFCRDTGSTGYDPLAVVDQRLKVKGLDGLRVVDGSIMPDLVSGNTNAPIIMIAEKAAELILADHR